MVSRSITAIVALREAREWAAVSDEEHAAISARSVARGLALEARAYEEKWAPHSEPATPEEWARYANPRRA